MGAETTSRTDFWSWENSPVSWDESDTTWDTASRVYYETNVDETVSLTDSTRKRTNKPVSEAVRMSDSGIRKAKAKRSWTESFALAEARTATYAFVGRDNIRTSERFKQVMRYNKTHDEKVSLQENMSRKAIYAERILPEHIGVGDHIKKTARLRKAEVLCQVTDAFLENANAVIDMVSFFGGAMDEATFAQRANTVQGYSPFKEFYVGDYEYQRALVKLSVSTEQLNSGINLYNVVHNVDIPDTDDRGTVHITDTTAPTKVYFNKFYYHAPEVSVTLVGGNVGDGIVIPNLTNLEGQDEDGRYFEVELIDLSGARKQGTVIWVSKGY